MDPEPLRTTAFCFVSTLKADRARQIAGIASTPDPDVVGDVILPAGASFQPDIPLLLEHDRLAPVGRVKLAKFPDKITFSGWIAEVLEPGIFKDRTDYAYHASSSGVIKGVSVGIFADPRDVTTNPATGARTWRKYQISELSLVAFPANVSAQITSIKSARSYLADPAGFPVSDPRRTSPPGVRVPGLVSGSRTMTPTQQIATYKSTLATKVAERDGLMTAAAAEGVTLTDEQSTQYEALETEIKSLDVHISRMEKLAESARDTAAPVSSDKAAPVRVQVTANRAPGIGFARIAIAKAQQVLTGIPALTFAQARFRDDSQLIAALKADVAPALPTDPEWAGNLIGPGTLAGEFLEYLRPLTILGQIENDLQKVPFNSRFNSQTTGGASNWVGAGLPKPVTSFEFGLASLGIAKVAGITVLTEDLIKMARPDAESVVRNALVKCVRERIDIDFIDPDVTAILNVRPASMTNGVAPLTSAGSTPADINTDIRALLAAVLGPGGSPSGVVLIMPTSVALSLAMTTNALGQQVFPGMSITGGTMVGIKVVVSDYAAQLGGSPSYGNVVVALNAGAVLLAEDGDITVDTSREATIEMSDTPGNPAGKSLSLWQTNSVGLRAERWITWGKARPNAAAWMSNVSWGA